ncbi:hypothetical protein H5410_025417 [Solanum commersonii]|uniref:Uncharacterized protein n=1 Tax=Solanum commersonii TaxID=4109 RepID=A0A9J5YVQ7_SOLCO|nr:hypothetical protein H5410_025417 [Solanum commersonii]
MTKKKKTLLKSKLWVNKLEACCIEKLCTHLGLRNCESLFFSWSCLNKSKAPGTIHQRHLPRYYWTIWNCTSKSSSWVFKLSVKVAKI